MPGAGVKQNPSPTIGPAPAYVSPLGNWSPLPSWMDTFNPMFGSLIPGAPKLGAAIKVAQGGDSVPVAGSFATTASFTTYSQTTSGNGSSLSITVRELVANRTVLSLSSSIPVNACALVYAQDLAGRFSMPVPINLAESWWLNGSTTGNANVIVGDTVSVYGQRLSKALNFSSGYDTTSPGTKCALWCVATYNGVSVGAYATCTSINPYRAQFVMPDLYGATSTSTSMTIGSTSLTFTTAADMSATWQVGLGIILYNSTSGAGGWMLGTISSITGTSVSLTGVSSEYQAPITSYSSWTATPVPTVTVHVHNGHGGIYGFSNGLTIGVCTLPLLYMDYTRTSVQMPAPRGSGLSDVANINAAITAAGPPITPFQLVPDATNTSGLPYLLDSKLLLSGSFGKPGRLGNGSQTVYVTGMSGFSDSSGDILENSTSGFISELNKVVCDSTAVTDTVHGATISVQRIINSTLTYNNSTFQNVIMVPSVSFYCTGSSITGMGIFIQNPTSCYIDGMTYLGVHNSRNNDPITIWGGANIQVTNSTFGHFNRSLGDAGMGTGRMVTCTITNYGTVRNAYMGGNSTPSRYDNITGAGHDAEFFLFDSTLGTASSGVVSATSNTITLYSCQSLAVNAGGGTFTLTFGGNTTAALAFNAPSSTVQSALQGLASIGAGNVIVSGPYVNPSQPPVNNYLINFAGTLTAVQAVITVNYGGLTGGTDYSNPTFSHSTAITADSLGSVTGNSRDAVMTAGTGLGQSVPILSRTGNTLTTATMSLVPDGTSIVNVVGYYANCVLYGNSATGGNVLNDGSFQGNSNGWHWFGGGFNMIADNNTFTDCNYGWSEWALNLNAGHCSVSSPTFFNVAQNNTFIHCNVGTRSRMDGPTANEAINYMGELRRNNTFTNTVLREWEFDGTTVDLDVTQDCLYQAITSGSAPAGSPIGIYTDPAFNPSASLVFVNKTGATFQGNGLGVAKALQGSTTNIIESTTPLFSGFLSGNG